MREKAKEFAWSTQPGLRALSPTWQQTHAARRQVQKLVQCFHTCWALNTLCKSRG
jgi:hypothetical protein